MFGKLPEKKKHEPIAIPTVNLPKIKTTTDVAPANNAEPIVNTTDAKINTTRRPNFPLKNADVNDPKIAPPIVMLTTTSCNSTDKLKCLFKGIIAPEITPVS